jgi:hypothetical protein
MRPSPLTTPELTNARVPGTVPGPGSELAPDASSHNTRDIDAITAAPIAAPTLPLLPSPRHRSAGGTDATRSHPTRRRARPGCTPHHHPSAPVSLALHLARRDNTRSPLLSCPGKCRPPAQHRPSRRSRLPRGHSATLSLLQELDLYQCLSLSSRCRRLPETFRSSSVLTRALGARMVRKR